MLGGTLSFAGHPARKTKALASDPAAKAVVNVQGDANRTKALEQKTLAANPDSIVDWEIDLASIRSQDSSHAWREYRKIRDDPPPEGDLEPAVYARLVQGRNGLVLQYWYLYIYNDAPNKHEGDWEMVSIQLNEQQQPVRAGYAGHAGGFRLEWDDVTRDGGDRPLVFVARGSHAAYFDHNPNGHRTNFLGFPKNLPKPVQSLVQGGYDLLRKIWPFRDHTPADPGPAGNPSGPVHKDSEIGERVDIQNIVAFPNFAQGAPPANFWWMRLDCKWGSRHVRGVGVIGPDPPWMHDKWHKPSEWINDCEDPPKDD